MSHVWARVCHVGGQKKEQPTHLAKDITQTLLDQQAYASKAFLTGDEARAMEAARRKEIARKAAEAKAAEEAAAIEAAKVRKDPNCPSFHGGFGGSKLPKVPVGGDLKFADSWMSDFLGEAPPYTPKAAPDVSEPSLPVATGAGGEGLLEGEGLAQDSSPSAEAAKLLASPFETQRSGGMTSVPPLASKLAAPFMSEPPTLPPPAFRLNTNAPPLRVDGTERGAKVAAPIVSEQPAQANPNLLNLLLEVPYKRGVHTVSVNQRYLNHEPTFDAAFELLPNAAAFGTLRAGCIYRFRMILTNVSNLPQRFVVKHGQQAKIVCAPGVVAAGLSRELEVEIHATDAQAGPLNETLTLVTEREEVLLPVSAHVLTAAEHDEHGRPPKAKGVRILASAPRDPRLGQTVPLTTRDVGAGTKRFSAPPRDPDAPPFDFYAYGRDDDDDLAVS